MHHNSAHQCEMILDMDTIYRIIDTQTGQQVGSDYTNRKRARSRADRLDLSYGAVRYIVKPIFPTE